MTETTTLTLDNIDLRGLGMNHLAYLRKDEMDGIKGFAICAADGSVLGFAPSRAQAIAAIMQNDLELVSLQ
mgnify:CR=1 FL=1|jgi:hypothetical protein